jgi:DNA-binding transcriptional LysR family regulator
MALLANHLTIRYIRIIDAIEEERSIARAADRLNVTQSAVTKALQEIEALTGLRLFTRTNRGVVPTHAGTQLTTDARRLLAHLMVAEQNLADLRDGTGGRLAIGTLLSASADLLPRAIAKVRRDNRRIVVKVVTGTDDVLMPALRAGELDMVIGRLSERHEPVNLVQEVLIPDNAVVVVRRDHPLTLRPTPRLHDLIEWDWILPPKETNLRLQIDRTFREEGVPPPAQSVESVSPLINKGLLLQADYICVMPAQVARIEEASGQLAILPVQLGATSGFLGITTLPESNRSATADLFIQALREIARTS